MSLALRLAQLEDVGFLALVLRPEDVADLRTFGVAPYDALRVGYLTADEALTATVDGEPAAMFGVSRATPLGRVGTPWFLGTHHVPAYRVPMVRTAKQVVAGWASRYSLLENYTPAANLTSQRWLRALGFELDPPVRATSGYYVRRAWLRGTAR